MHPTTRGTSFGEASHPGPDPKQASLTLKDPCPRKCTASPPATLHRPWSTSPFSILRSHASLLPSSHISVRCHAAPPITAKRRGVGPSDKASRNHVETHSTDQLGQVPGWWLADNFLHSCWASDIHKDQTMLLQVPPNLQRPSQQVQETTLSSGRLHSRQSPLHTCPPQNPLPESSPRGVDLVPITENDTPAWSDLLCLQELVLRRERGGKQNSKCSSNDLRRHCELKLEASCRAPRQDCVPRLNANVIRTTYLTSFRKHRLSTDDKGNIFPFTSFFFIF